MWIDMLAGGIVPMTDRHESPWERLTLRAAYLILAMYLAAVILSAIDRTYEIPAVLSGLVPMVIGALLGPTAIGWWRKRNGDEDK